jgi:hypothetical protein
MLENNRYPSGFLTPVCFWCAASKSAASLAGNWHGDYTNADSNQVTKASLRIVEEQGGTDSLTAPLRRR